jgi:hypothetical protein
MRYVKAIGVCSAFSAGYYLVLATGFYLHHAQQIPGLRDLLEISRYTIS